jgi:hypothetical protein
MSIDVNAIISELVDAWCSRRELKVLSYVLPAWTSNNGLTDCWTQLHDDLAYAYAVCRDLPDDERGKLKDAYVAIEVRLHNRGG